MREIKFRIWQEEEKYMLLDNDLLSGDCGCYWDGDKYANLTTDCIVMMYTGLKDKNGVEIYEGDIIDINLRWCKKGKTKVVFEDCAFELFSHEGLWQGQFWKQNEVYFEVIGNIYENPELLNG